MKKLTICVDFDGTCVTHDFPYVGEDIGAQRVLKRLVAEGHKLILFTMRSDVENPTSKDPNITLRGGKFLTDAVQWFKKNEIPLHGINTNPTQKEWTHSPKAYGDLYIDDAALGIPLTITAKHTRHYVDWPRVEKMLENRGILKSGINNNVSWAYR